MPNQILEYILAIIEDVDELKWQKNSSYGLTDGQGLQQYTRGRKKKKNTTSNIAFRFTKQNKIIVFDLSLNT